MERDPTLSAIATTLVMVMVLPGPVSVLLQGGLGYQSSQTDIKRNEGMSCWKNKGYFSLLLGENKDFIFLS